MNLYAKSFVTNKCGDFKDYILTKRIATCPCASVQIVKALIRSGFGSVS